MESNSIFILNGRATKDSPAKYTFVNTSGKSVIDLEALSLIRELTKILKVKENFQLNIGSAILKTSSQSEQRLIIILWMSHTIFLMRVSFPRKLC